MPRDLPNLELDQQLSTTILEEWLANAQAREAREQREEEEAARRALLPPPPPPIPQFLEQDVPVEPTFVGSIATPTRGVPSPVGATRKVKVPNPAWTSPANGRTAPQTHAAPSLAKHLLRIGSRLGVDYEILDATLEQNTITIVLQLEE